MAYKVVDGIYTRTFIKSAVQCSHTSLELQPWWAVDPEAVYNIYRVVVFGRTDCCDYCNVCCSDFSWTTSTADICDESTSTVSSTLTRQEEGSVIIPHENNTLCFCPCKHQQQTNENTHLDTQANEIIPLDIIESLSIVEQIKRRQLEELENKFCVVSFSQETHNKHRRITRPSVEGRLRIKKMDEADFVVTNDKSVLNIPRCKVILVFVDHNQKDVILETPGEDEEDIKLLTVQACRKMGADVFVIYVGDEGSESLMAGCLYNPQLITVAEHFELKQLEQRNRVITCHEKFTITQREKVAQAIA
ncbi:unnamed protein product [Mytilus coruscus]|uniref:Uncharacterized protein n=1 Tax=Mytilus coruscus TaxID=42192 RepID=A0A6J8EJ97_MYTCO|nr:unnamed protein product [Mytilus coruscus]